jgi:protein-tyrosine phosphatase
VLFLLQIPEAIVTEDYIRSTPELLPERETRLQEINEIGLSEDFANTPIAWIGQMKAYIDDLYGGTEAYLLQIGVSQTVMKNVKESFSV